MKWTCRIQIDHWHYAFGCLASELEKVHGHSGIGTLRAIHENTTAVEYERNGIVQCTIYHTTRIAYYSEWSLEMVER